MTLYSKVMNAMAFIHWLIDNSHQIYSVANSKLVNIDELVDVVNEYSKYVEEKEDE